MMNTRRIFYFTAFLLMLVFSAAPMNAKNDNQDGTDGIPFFALGQKTDKNYREGEILVKYKEKNINLESKKGRKKASSFLKEEGLEKLGEAAELNLQLLKSSEKTEDLASKLKNNPDVEYAEPNYLRYPEAIPNDPSFSSMWGLNNTGQTVNGKSGTADADIDAPEAWDGEQDANQTVIVAIVDTGVEYTHPDLAGNMWDGSSCKDEYGNPVVGGCPNHGWNYEASNNNPNDTGHTDPAYDGHGTFVSGIIGAVSNNSTGVSGISVKNKMKIMAIRFAFDVFSEVKAINFAKNNGARVINASYVGDTSSELERSAIESFPGIFIAAAGNGGADSVGDNNDAAPQYPCGYSSSNIICVAATNQNDQLTSFSNYGSSSVDIAAPGENILSTYKSAYAYGNGTSFATPYVSGIAGMLYSSKSSATQSEIRYDLLNSGDSKSSLSGKISTGKRANLKNAVSIIGSLSLSSASSVYRFWSDQKQHHFYTIDAGEKDYVIANYPANVWKYERIAYDLFSQNGTGLSPIYRFWSDQKQGHFYTIDSGEKDYVIANYPADVWKYERIAFYAYASEFAETKPVYRFWSDQKQGHFYTASEDEKNYVIANYPTNIWKYEGIAWYVPND